MLSNVNSILRHHESLSQLHKDRETSAASVTSVITTMQSAVTCANCEIQRRSMGLYAMAYDDQANAAAVSNGRFLTKQIDSNRSAHCKTNQRIDSNHELECSNSKKAKAQHLYSASSCEPHPRSAQIWITQLFPPNTPYPTGYAQQMFVTKLANQSKTI